LDELGQKIEDSESDSLKYMKNLGKTSKVAGL